MRGATSNDRPYRDSQQLYLHRFGCRLVDGIVRNICLVSLSGLARETVGRCLEPAARRHRREQVYGPRATMIAVASGARDIMSDLILPRDLPTADTMAFGT